MTYLFTVLFGIVLGILAFIGFLRLTATDQLPRFLIAVGIVVFTPILLIMLPIIILVS